MVRRDRLPGGVRRERAGRAGRRERAGGAGAFTAREAEVANFRRTRLAAGSPDAAGYQPRWEEEVSLRMVMIHVLLEYGRRNGHADFLREGIDGSAGA